MRTPVRRRGKTRTSRLAVFAAVSTVLLLGCPTGDGGSPAGDQTPAGETPEETFKALKAAAEEEDYATVFNCLDPGMHNRTLLEVMLTARSLTLGTDEDRTKAVEKELSAIAETYKLEGVKKKRLGYAEEVAKEEVAQDVFGDVEDKAGLFEELIKLLKKYKCGGHSSLPFSAGTLRDVKTIEGDRATGIVEESDGGTNPVQFVERDGRWYLEP